jgi:uncharacterized coiled-coil protein SlyX
VSIVSKFLVVLVVVVSLGVSVMMATYATIQPNYKLAYEQEVQQREAMGVAVLTSGTDRFITDPVNSMTLAVERDRNKVLAAARDKAVADAEEAKARHKAAELRIVKLEEPVSRLQIELTEVNKILGATQDDLRGQRSQNTTLQGQLIVSEKKAAESEMLVRALEAKNATLIAQSRSLDQRIRELERQVQKAEAQLDEMAVFVQQAQFAGAGGDNGGPNALPGISGNIPGGGGLTITPGGRGSLRLAEPKRVRGKVSDVKMSDGIPYITVNVGEDDKVAIGDKLHVFRTNPPTYVGVMHVTRIDYHRAAGRVDVISPGAEVKTDDEVTNDLKTLR